MSQTLIQKRDIKHFVIRHESGNYPHVIRFTNALPLRKCPVPNCGKSVQP